MLLFPAIGIHFLCWRVWRWWIGSVFFVSLVLFICVNCEWRCNRISPRTIPTNFYLTIRLQSCNNINAGWEKTLKIDEKSRVNLWYPLIVRWRPWCNAFVFARLYVKRVSVKRVCDFRRKRRMDGTSGRGGFRGRGGPGGPMRGRSGFGDRGRYILCLFQHFCVSW